MHSDIDDIKQYKRNEMSTMGFQSGNTKLQNMLKDKAKPSEAAPSGEETAKNNTEGIYNNAGLIDIQKKVISEINAAFVQTLSSEADIREHIEYILDTICEKNLININRKEKSAIVQSLIDELSGFGPLQGLILDNDVSEIMVNGANQVYVERKGLIELTDIKFRDNDHVMQIIDKIVSPLGRRVDESSPMVDARLPNGSRVNIIIPPVSIKGPAITIRKFAATPLTMNRMVMFGALTEKMSKFLEAAVQTKANIIVAGGTGSGKTTLLNALSSFIPDGERIITIEDAAELQLLQRHVIALEARPSNIEGKGEVTIRDMVKNSLRMRPDRIIVGEVRGAETLDMLQAMNTGHSGSLSTVHANSPRDAISRMETMVLYSGIDFPVKVIREQICSALDLIVYTERLSDGTRKVTQITEVLGIEGDIILLQDIFYFEKMGKLNGKIRGEFKSNSIRPKLYDKFEAMGFSMNSI